MKFGTDIWNLKRKNPFVGGQNPKKVSLFLPHFIPNWDLHNAFSMGVLKHFSGVVCNDVVWRPPTPECYKRAKECVARVTWPRKICVLNANISVRAEAMDFKFCMHAPMDNPDMTPKKLWKGGRGYGHVTP